MPHALCPMPWALGLAPCIFLAAYRSPGLSLSKGPLLNLWRGPTTDQSHFLSDLTRVQAAEAAQVFQPFASLTQSPSLVVHKIPSASLRILPYPKFGPFD